MGARVNAANQNMPTYEGKPCAVCATLGMMNTHRYTSNGNCIACSQRRLSADQQGVPVTRIYGEWLAERTSARYAREAAIQAGASTYDGMKCRTCGGRERFVTSKACKHCTNERNKAQSKANTERKRALHHSPLLRIEAGKFRECEHTAAMNQVLPELQGASLVYARCPQTVHLMERVPHYGRCVLCYPDALINISNQIVWGNLPGLDAETVSFITRLCKVPFNSGTPYSLATLCMAAYNKRQGYKPITPPQLPPLPLPGGRS